MATLADARLELAALVTAAGVPCSPYPLEQLSPPAAFVDTMTVDYDTAPAQSFCTAGQATATVVVAWQANDRPGAIGALEDLVPLVVKGVADAGGRVASVATGTTDIGGQSLPASIYSVRFST